MSKTIIENAIFRIFLFLVFFDMISFNFANKKVESNPSNLNSEEVPPTKEEPYYDPEPKEEKKTNNFFDDIEILYCSS